jgi:hypothetical protein
MKRTISLNLTCILSLALLVWSATINGQSEEQIKRFNEDRETYFNENLALSDSEKEAFWPVYNDFNHRKIKVMEEERNTFRYSHENAGILSDEEINEILARILDYKEQVFKLEQEYYKDKFPKVIPPEKVLKLYKVEWDFRKHLVRKLRGEGKGHGQHNKDRPSKHPEPMPLF